MPGVPRHSEMPEKFARWLEIFHVMDKKGDVFGRFVFLIKDYSNTYINGVI